MSAIDTMIILVAVGVCYLLAFMGFGVLLYLVRK
jgi:hypothetical protein